MRCRQDSIVKNIFNRSIASILLSTAVIVPSYAAENSNNFKAATIVPTPNPLRQAQLKLGPLKIGDYQDDEVQATNQDNPQKADDDDELGDDAAQEELNSGKAELADDETPSKKALEAELAARTEIDNPFKEPVQVVVSLNEQALKVYRGEEVIASSKISSGKRGHATPTGIFSILNKRRKHFSNIYDNAPMPYMQRLTWTGIALHGSRSVPRYAASHGCVRLPFGFDKKLFSMTNFGGHVIVTGNAEAPTPIRNAVLPNFQPRTDFVDAKGKRIDIVKSASATSDDTAKILKANITSEDSQAATAPTEPLKTVTTQPHSKQKPIRIVITRNHNWLSVKDVQKMLHKIGLYDDKIDGQAGPATLSAVRAYQNVLGMEDDGKINKEFVKKLAEESGFPAPKNGKLMVRKNYKPFYEEGINIKLPEKPLGTHLLVAQKAEKHNDGTVSFVWNSYSVENRLLEEQIKAAGIEATGPEGNEVPEKTDVTKTLERIDIPLKVRNSVEKYMSVGASLLITDTGMQRYTGKGTDFIVKTRVKRNYKAAAPDKPKKKYRKKQIRKKRSNVAMTSVAPARKKSSRKTTVRKRVSYKKAKAKRAKKTVRKRAIKRVAQKRTVKKVSKPRTLAQRFKKWRKRVRSNMRRVN